MTDPQRRVHRPDADAVKVREAVDSDDSDGLFRIRMPVTSTAEARDGVAFDRSKVDGFRAQIERERIPVFLDHGRNESTGSRYSALGKIGYLDNPELAERGDQTDLDADFVLADPSELDGDVGEMREALSWVRQQARLDFPLASSIGWSDDTGERDLPGDADLLECSLVGVPSDARTTTASAETAPESLARAVSAASSEFDVEAFTEALRNLDDPAFAEGDRVMWSSNDTPVHGRVADVGDEFSPAEDVTITGDDGEAVYLIHELDDSLEPPQYRRANVAKPESSLDDSGMDMPPVEGNFADSENSMTDENTEPDEESGADTADEQERMGAEEFRERMVEMQEEQTAMLREMKEDRMDGDDEDGEDDGEGDEENSTDVDQTASDDSDVEERTVTLDGEERSVDEVRDMVADLRDQLDDTDGEDIDEPATKDRVADEDADEAESAEPLDWRA